MLGVGAAHDQRQSGQGGIVFGQLILVDDGVKRALVTVMAQFSIRNVIRRGALAFGHRENLVARSVQKLGVRVDERFDALRIEPGWSEAPAVIETHNDHRIAMALAIAALGARGPSTIDGSEAVAISYPGFFETLGRLVA